MELRIKSQVTLTDFGGEEGSYHVCLENQESPAPVGPLKQVHNFRVSGPIGNPSHYLVKHWFHRGEYDGPNCLCSEDADVKHSLDEATECAYTLACQKARKLAMSSGLSDFVNQSKRAQRTIVSRSAY